MRVSSAVIRVVPGLMLAIAMLGYTGVSFAASADAAVSGVVRDVHGTPQLGAMVQLLSASAVTVATAFTDDHGRYIMPSVLPGRYRLRATAAFFVPAIRPNVRLEAGAQAIVNLTMSTLFEAENWLPAQRRRADEPADDWKWTLRSTANRPLLRLVDPEDGVSISSSGEQAHKYTSQGRVSLVSGDGAFGEGGTHQVVVLNRTIENGESAVLRADIGDPKTPYPAGASVDVTTGYERRSPLGGSTRLVSSLQIHPELMDGGMPGFQVLQLASTQQIELGDAVQIDVGTLLEAERLEETRILSEPFVRATVRPDENTVVQYRFASGRDLQSSEDLDHLKPAMSVLSDAMGRPLNPGGSHNEVSISRKMNGRVLTFAAFSDHLDNATLEGGGAIDRAAIGSAAMIADPTTGTFRLAADGYSGRGLSVALMQPITQSLSAYAEYDLGTALMSNGGMPAITDLQSNLTRKTETAASLTVHGKIVRSGTAMKAEYRWQAARSLTQVNAYNNAGEDAYLSFYVRQKLWCGRLLPQGIDAVVEATNLLEQGYQPVLAPDGRTLFLAQIPRAIQGGLAFNF
jgi:hypothetical protein